MIADPRDARSLGWARAAFGIVFLLRTTPLLGRRFSDALPLWGWPHPGWHVPVMAFALPASLVAALCILRTAAAFAFTLGVRSRVAGVIAGTAGFLVLAQDAFGYYHHLHMLFLGMILFGLTDAGAWFALRSDAPRAPASSVLFLRLWVASVYAWAAVGKLRLDWLDGSTLQRFHQERALSGAMADTLFATSARATAVAWTVLLAELAMGPLLLWRPTRRFALIGALAMHALFESAGRVDSIGWQMAALLLVFLDGEPAFMVRSRHALLAMRSALARTSRR